MKLLYLSSWHGTLEYDDLKLFTEMGIDWFSSGYYANPREPMNSRYIYGKPPIDKDIDLDLLNEFTKLNPHRTVHQSINLNKEFVSKFDIVLVVNCAPCHQILTNNIEIIKSADKPLLWRTYGQQQDYAEKEVNYRRKKYPIKIIRGSPKERLINHYAGEDYIIRPYVDETKFNGWHGSEKYILSFNNFYNQRQTVSNTREYEAIINYSESKLYGDQSDAAPNYNGFLNEDDQLKAYQECKLYFALGSKPAFMTYNMIEAMMVGCPVFTWGPLLGGETFEGPELFENGKDCIMNDNLYELKHMLWNPYARPKLNGRDKAISIFGKQKCRAAWEQLFKELV